MMEPIAPYTLPADVRSRLITLASEADLLIFGEMHGTQEVPRLLLGLRDALAETGYHGLALEIPCDQHAALTNWAQGATEVIPTFFQPADFYDGRESVQSLALIQQMAGSPERWRLLCFDLGGDQPYEGWVERDARMAGNLIQQWQQLCPDRKVVAVCGNLHSRLAQPPDPEDPFRDLWPSFACKAQQLLPEKEIRSILTVFHGGTFFNERVQSFVSQPPHLEAEAEIRASRRGDHTMELHLPHATAVTFFSPAS